MGTYLNFIAKAWNQSLILNGDSVQNTVLTLKTIKKLITTFVSTFE